MTVIGAMRYGAKYEHVGMDFKTSVEAMQRRQAALDAVGSGVAFERLGRCFPDAPDDPSFRTFGGRRRSSEHGIPHARRVCPEVVVGAAPARDKVHGD
jgi:hypothetical protein